MFEEIIKEFDAKKQRQDELEAMMPHFETEEEALQYAVRLTQLQPGVRVKAPIGKTIGDYVFLYFHKDNGFLLGYDSDKKTLHLNIVAPHQIVLD